MVKSSIDTIIIEIHEKIDRKHNKIYCINRQNKYTIHKVTLRDRKKERERKILASP